MQQIFEGKVYDIIKKPDGFVFSYLEQKIDDEHSLIRFKMFDTKTGNITDVAKNVYLLSKFGSNYKPAIKLTDNFVTVKSIYLPSGKLFLCKNTGECFLLDGDGSILWTGSILYRDEAPSDIALYNNCVWASFYENNVLIRFNIATMREELRIGGKKSPFLNPCSIFTDDNIATVCSAGSNSLTRVDLDTYSVEPYREFNQSLKNYIKSGAFEFVLLESGIYKL